MRRTQRDVIMLAAAVFNFTWLRSGNAVNAYKSGYLTASGVYDTTYDARRFAVRPALYKKDAFSYNVCGGGFLTFYRLHLAAYRR